MRAKGRDGWLGLFADDAGHRRLEAIATFCDNVIGPAFWVFDALELLEISV